jgi:hypothetical protein
LSIIDSSSAVERRRAETGRPIPALVGRSAGFPGFLMPDADFARGRNSAAILIRIKAGAPATSRQRRKILTSIEAINMADRQPFREYGRIEEVEIDASLRASTGVFDLQY